MFSERGSHDLSNGTNVASQLANFFFVCTSIVYDHVSRGVTSMPTVKLTWLDKGGVIHA